VAWPPEPKKNLPINGGEGKDNLFFLPCALFRHWKNIDPVKVSRINCSIGSGVNRLEWIPID
jgi:hypothetical protein